MFEWLLFLMRVLSCICTSKILSYVGAQYIIILYLERSLINAFIVTKKHFVIQY